MKKLLTLTLVLCLLLGSVSAMAATVSPVGEFPITDEVIELSIMTINYWNLTDEDYALDPWIQEIEEKTNIRLIPVPIPSTDAATKRNLMLAGDNYPDIIAVNFNRSEIMQFGVMDGILVDIKDAIDEYGHELKALFEYNPDYYSGLIAPDGGIYGIPNIDEGIHTMAYPKMYIRQDWLDAVGLSMPEDTETFREMLRAFVATDLNGNGEADEIGLTGGIESQTPIQWLLIGQAFVTCRPDFWLYSDEETSDVVFAPGTEAYREGLRYIKSLYDEGLIDPAAFTQKTDQLKVTIRTEPYSVGAYVCDHVAMGLDSNDYEESKNYQVLPVPLMGPEGFREQPNNNGFGEVGSFSIVVTDACENVEAAVRLIDYLMSEEQTMNKWLGMEDRDWEKVDLSEGLTTITGEPLRYRKIVGYEGTGGDTVRFYSITAPFFKSLDIGLSALPGDADPYEASSYEQRIALDSLSLIDYRRDLYLPKNIFISETDTEEYNEIQTNINDFVQKTCVQFILGERDIETGWDQYLSELERYNVSRYVEIYTEAYESMNRN